MSKSITYYTNGQLSPETMLNGDVAQRNIQYRFNNGAHIPPRTGASSANYTGATAQRGKSYSHDIRGLNSQRGLSQSINNLNALTVATGLVPESGNYGGTKSTLKKNNLSQSYGFSDRTKNITGMNPRLLGVSNDMLYTPPTSMINAGSEDAMIYQAEHAGSSSLADRIRKVGGTVV